tara:strand:+ start:124 stop:297 length:174 start_codon:yes stop_codon:yes gene_type:complete
MPGSFFCHCYLFYRHFFFAARKAPKTVSSNESYMDLVGFAFGLQRLHQCDERIAAAG